MLIDTHAHLDAAEFDADREAVVQAATQAGVARVVVPSVWRGNFAAVSQLAARHDSIRVAFGIHPMYVGGSADEDLDAVRAQLAAGGAVAVGEIGLDFFVEPVDVARQTRFFVEQLKLAREFDLPVILHIRRAQDTILKHLRQIRVRGGIAHAFNGSRVQAEAFIQLGFKLGFGGTMTYPRALRIRALAANLPLESIVLETDAPDIPPAWLRAQRNAPCEMPRIAETLAELRGIPVAEVIEATGRNACAVLPGLAGPI